MSGQVAGTSWNSVDPSYKQHNAVAAVVTVAVLDPAPSAKHRN